MRPERLRRVTYEEVAYCRVDVEYYDNVEWMYHVITQTSRRHVPTFTSLGRWLTTSMFAILHDRRLVADRNDDGGYDAKDAINDRLYCRNYN